jgi:uncharacterized protein involved in high-affinity Fe2+ transport
MKKFATVSILALTIASGAAFAQTQTAPSTTPSTPATPPAATMPSTTPPAASTMPSTGSAAAMDAATDAKFKAADKSGKGFIEGAALDPYKPVMAKVDTDKDGKISRAEFAAGVKAGLIK